jgi:pimeloyl-ACP methyl ester carboxylesterase
VSQEAEGERGVQEALMASHDRPATAVERARTPLPPDPNRVLHFVPPQATDPSIDQFLQDHYALLNGAAPTNGLLFVFLPGTYARPRDHQRLLDEAARLGFHVLGIEYPSVGDDAGSSMVMQVCSRDPDPACHGEVRAARISGGEARGVSVTPANSIENRLVRALSYLGQQYPDEAWDAFVVDGQVDWSRLVVGGHSQGGGMAAYLAKQHAVARVAMFSGPSDFAPAARCYASWLAQPSATPVDRYYGLVHAEERAARSMLGAYATLGLSQYGEPPVLSGTQPPPPEAHVIVVTLPHRLQQVTVLDPFHGSTAADGVTPLDADGRPAYAPVWAALLVGP